MLALIVTPVGYLLLWPLENRFPQPPADMPAPYGIIILGGALNGGMSTAHNQPVFDEGERVVVAALLAKRYPSAKILFSGGNGSLLASSSTEADEARKLLIGLGVDPARITLEDQSRNTDENARFSAALVHPEPSQRWLLVTSAFHMPRSMGLYEKAGFNVTPYPVAFRTYGPGSTTPWNFDPARNLRAGGIRREGVDRACRLSGDGENRHSVSRAGGCAKVGGGPIPATALRDGKRRESRSDRRAFPCGR